MVELALLECKGAVRHDLVDVVSAPVIAAIRDAVDSRRAHCLVVARMKLMDAWAELRGGLARWNSRRVHFQVVGRHELTDVIACIWLQGGLER